MKVFTMSEFTVICEFQSMRSGFKHTAVLLINEHEICKTKCTYQNRTWEQYQYQSVFHKILDKTNSLSKRQKTLFRKKYDERAIGW